MTTMLWLLVMYLAAGLTVFLAHAELGGLSGLRNRDVLGAFAAAVLAWPFYGIARLAYLAWEWLRA